MRNQTHLLGDALLVGLFNADGEVTDGQAYIEAIVWSVLVDGISDAETRLVRRQ